VWGIIPAAGAGSRIQPLAFSKELLPLGVHHDGDIDRPRAVSEFLVERMLAAGATKLCFVIAPGKSDILEYFGGSIDGATISYVVQPEPGGLCDAIFRAAPLIAPDEAVLVGLPDTLWFPIDGFCRLAEDALSFLLFHVERPELFDAVIADESGRVEEIQVKTHGARSPWVWGAFRLPGATLHDLHALWQQAGQRDEYFGTLVNAYLARGGSAHAWRAVGGAYVDVGTFDGYRSALRLLEQAEPGADHPPGDNHRPAELGA
jgi:dTDP-glucose pyrophosphorylase